MYASDGTKRIIEELEYLETGRRQIRERGPHFRIIHRYNPQFTPCGPHEEIAAVYLIHAGNAIQVRLGTILLTLFDFMARHNQLAQTAVQIERGTRTGGPRRFNHASASDLTSGILRRYVRVYIDRIRVALGRALREAVLDTEPAAVLISEETALNQTEYRLRGTFEWLHTSE